MNDVELVVGARNEAKAVLAELGQQLSGLAAPAEQGAFRAQAAIATLIAQVSKAAASLTGVLGAVTAGLAGAVAASAAKSLHDESDAVDSLNRRLDNYVGKQRISTEAHQAFARELERSLNVSAADTLGLMEKASALGVAQNRLGDAASAAIGLSKALGIDLNSALTKVINGDEDLVSLLDSVNSGLREQSGDVSEAAGLWNFLQSQAKQTLDFILQATAPLRESLAQVGAVIKDAFVTGLIGAVTAVQVFRDDTASSFGYVGVAAQLLFRQLIEDTKHAFTEAMPAYVIWFTDNFFALMRDGFMAILEIQRNFSQALGQALVETWNFVASGGKGGIDKFNRIMIESAATLLGDLELKAQAIPDIIDRKITNEEAALAKRMGELGKTLGGSFSDKFRENMASIQEFLNPKAPQLSAKDLDFSKAKDSAKEAGKLAATESRLLTRGEGNLQQRMLATAKDQVSQLQALNTKVDRLNQIEEQKRRGVQLEIIA